MLEVKIPDGPGSVKFWPKDSSVTFGTDPNPGNYVAVIAQEARTSSAGLAVVDMADVVAAFKALGTTQAGLFSGQVCTVHSTPLSIHATGYGYLAPGGVWCGTSPPSLVPTVLNPFLFPLSPCSLRAYQQQQ